MDHLTNEQLGDDILLDHQIEEMIVSLEWAIKSGDYDNPNHHEAIAIAIAALEKIQDLVL